MSAPATISDEPVPVADALASLDLKCALVGAGVRYPQEVYDAVVGWARLEPPSNPYACNCLILPGEVAVHLHANENSRFALGLQSGKPGLFEDGTPVAEVTFPTTTSYYQQKTSAGHPFGSIAVLEGRSTLAFFYLWSCDYVKTQETCSFCFQVRAEMAGYKFPSASHAEVAEIIRWAIENVGVQEVQLTAGTLIGSQTECLLAELDPAMTDKTVLLAWARNSQPLAAGQGPFRLVVPGEKRQARWVRQVTAIEMFTVDCPAIRTLRRSDSWLGLP